ncbi:Ribonuclease H2 subunit A [Amphibalanus amphitrite]|uniref:Ribonuclease n=1 Tax=Amphibalanus amphitrite TaxID=1232801 RepID=A0A6A4X808_AMPAM|nr:Ribonuclease H2 subunit A [Amphibalanus amphitrite]
MSYRGALASELYEVPRGQTVTAYYYVNEVLEKTDATKMLSRWRDFLVAQQLINDNYQTRNRQESRVLLLATVQVPADIQDFQFLPDRLKIFVTVGRGGWAAALTALPDLELQQLGVQLPPPAPVLHLPPAPAPSVQYAGSSLISAESQQTIDEIESLPDLHQLLTPSPRPLPLSPSCLPELPDLDSILGRSSSANWPEASTEPAKYNLNWMSHDAAIALISRAREAGVNVTQVFVDTVGPPEKYQAKLEARFPGLQITVSKKADALFPTVSAASICAKVVRDRALETWRCPETVPMDVTKLGSGYPADPQTKRFLAEGMDPVFGFPSLVRFSWSTCQTLLDKSAVGVQWEESDEEIDEAAQNTPSVASFFGGGSAQRHVFFTECRLKPAAPL